MGSPSVVMPFLAVSLELPMILAGALVSIRKLGSMIGDVFLADAIAAKSEKKRALAMCEIAIGACLLLAVIVAATGNMILVAIAFVAAFFMIGLIEEIQGLMLVDFLSNHLNSNARIWQHYLQLGLGGVGAIALTLVVHEITKGQPPFQRHSAVVAIATVCFLVSAVFVMAVRELTGTRSEKVETPRSPRTTVTSFLSDARTLFGERWFRKYLAMRLPLVVVALAVPFFALIAAESHHSSARGMTALIISSAAGYLVAAPLWHVVNMKSHQVVMITGSLLVAGTGLALILMHFGGLDHDVRAHSIALFVATIAVTGTGGARKLYFMDIAPEDQRIKASAVIKSVSRLSAVIVGAGLAAVAHSQEVVWAIVFIVAASVFAAYACSRFVAPHPKHKEAAR